MRKIWLPILLILFAFSVSFADRLDLKNGDKDGGNATYKSGEFKVGKTKVQRGDVKKVLFGEVKGTTTDTDTRYALTKEQIAKWNATADSMLAQYPEASGLIFVDYERATLTGDGRDVSEIHFTGKVLTQDTKWWANRGWYIDEGINRVKILYARSIAPDGTISDYSPEDITYSEPSRGEVFFGKGMSMSLTIPNVEIGSIVDFGYIQEEYSPEDPELFTASFYFQSNEPAKNSKCEFEVPKGRKLYYTTFLMEKNDPLIGFGARKLAKFSGSPDPIISQTDSSEVYTWELKDIEPIISEDNSMDYGNISPNVHAALYPDFSYYNKRFKEIHNDHIKLTPQLDSLAKAIVGDAKTETGKIARLYHWEQRNIRYISVKGALASRFGGHYAQITFDNKYGDCSDKAMLFSTLLKAVGIESYPIILMTNDAAFLDRSRFPFWWGNHAINEVWWDGKPHILDVTNNLFRFPYYPMGDCDIWYCNFVRGEAVYNPPVAPEENAMMSKTYVTLTPDGSANILDSMSFTGNMEVGYRGYFQYTPKKKHRLVMEQFMAQRKAGGTLNNFSVVNVDSISLPFKMDFDYTVKDYLIPAGDYYLLDVPALRYDFPEIDLRERNYGIKLDMVFMRAHNVAFVLPKGFSAKYLPGQFDISNDYFEYHANFMREGKNVHFVDSYKIKKMRVPVSDYEKYKADAEKVLAYLKERVFLVKG
jgi:hypothetical protein